MKVNSNDAAFPVSHITHNVNYFHPGINIHTYIANTKMDVIINRSKFERGWHTKDEKMQIAEQSAEYADCLIEVLNRRESWVWKRYIV